MNSFWCVLWISQVEACLNLLGIARGLAYSLHGVLFNLRVDSG